MNAYTFHLWVARSSGVAGETEHTIFAETEADARKILLNKLRWVLVNTEPVPEPRLTAEQLQATQDFRDAPGILRPHLTAIEAVLDALAQRLEPGWTFRVNTVGDIELVPTQEDTSDV